MRYEIRVPSGRVHGKSYVMGRRLIAVAVILFVVVNVVLLAVYHNRTYPRTFVAGKAVGNVGFAQVPTRLKQLSLLPTNLELRYGKEQRTASVASLGIELDAHALQAAVQKRGWLPLWNIVRRNDVPLTPRINDNQMHRQLAPIAASVAAPASDARIVQAETGFSLTKGVDGRQLDMAASKAALLAGVSSGRQTVDLPIRSVPPTITNASLAEPFKKLKTAQGLAINYSNSTHTQAAKSAEIVSWYRRAGNGFGPADAEIKAYITSVSRQWQLEPKNLDTAVAATRQALDSGKPLNFQLQAKAYTPAKTFTYCTAVRGVDTSYLPQLEQKLATTYTDARGWSLGGPVNFVHGTGNCDLTVWLSAANQMSSFGDICDSQWSCTVSPHVIINFDRWQNASDSWNAAALNINDYRSMVINHETGHWLGFGHSLCPGPGQPAPVMQQQSISLGSCVFSPWPDAGEQATLRATLGL